MGRHPVVRQAIPGREFKGDQIGGKKAKCARQLGEPRTVTADNHEAGGGGSRTRRNRSREVGDDQGLRAIGHPRQCQGVAGAKKIGG